jgi:hypothetical protein
VFRDQVITALLISSGAAQQPAPLTYVAVVAGPDVRVTGSMTPVANGIAAASGAKVESAKHNAVLNLTRGGVISLCQNSILGMDARGSQLFLALQSGTIEAKYPLSAAADNLLTADYRISIISGSGMPGQNAEYRLGIGTRGDVLIQVLPSSQTFLIVSSNFDNSQAVVRPGEIRGFAALGSNLDSAQIEKSIALRCPVENRPQTQQATAIEEKVPANSLQIPLAYRSPELPAIEKRPPPPATAAGQVAAPAKPAVAIPQSVAPVAPPTASVQAQESAKPVAVAKPARDKKKSGNPIARFFRHLFGRKAK